MACTVSILRQMSDYHYQEYINHFPTRTDLTDFLTEIFLVFKDLVSKNVFPSDWSMMILQQNRCVLALALSHNHHYNLHHLVATLWPGLSRSDTID